MLLVILRKVDVCNLQCEVSLNSNIFLGWGVSPLLPSMFCHIFLEFSQYAHTGEMHGAILNNSKFLSKWYFESVCNLVTSQDCFVSNAAPFLPFRSEIDKITVETHHMTTASVWPLFCGTNKSPLIFSSENPVNPTTRHYDQRPPFAVLSRYFLLKVTPYDQSKCPVGLLNENKHNLTNNTFMFYWMFLGKGVLVVNMTAGKLQHSVKRMQLVNY